MPHFIIDCSESILSLADPCELMRSVYAAAESTGLFARSGVGGIKVRLRPYRHFTNVDANSISSTCSPTSWKAARRNRKGRSLRE